MKTKIVLWGENEKDEKILLGIQLLDSLNVIRIHVTPEAEATEVFYNQMMNQWREGQEVSMPESTQVIDRPLSMTEGLLPDNIKTQRQDVLARAKTEWHFVILSSKLYEAYADEVAQIKERVSELTEFDEGIWEEMKSFWKKVQNQVQEKNLFREHATELRSKTNELFDSLKSLKRAMNDEFEKLSKGNFDQYIAKLDDVEARIEKGLGLQPIFNELKNIQGDFKSVKFTRKHHNDIWKRIDGAFKKVKEKRFGGKAGGNHNPVNRLTRRFEGLMGAIGKMEQSINRDIKDKQFQIKRIDTTDGQLELQIRQAKMAMIEERIKSKQVKLDDMLKTRGELEGKIESEKKRAEAREAKQAKAKEVKKAKDSIKKDIAKEIEGRNADLKTDEQKLQKAAEAIKASKSSKKKPAKAVVPPVPVEVKAEESVEAKVEEVTEQVVEAKTEAVKTEVVTPEAPTEQPSTAVVEETKEAVSEEPASEEIASEAIVEKPAKVVEEKTEADVSEVVEAVVPEPIKKPATEPVSEVASEIEAVAYGEEE